MISVSRSRSYFGRSLYSQTPVAYLCLQIEPGAACSLHEAHTAWTRIEEVLPPSVSASGAAGLTDRIFAATDQGRESRLGSLLGATIVKVCLAVGEPSPAVRWSAFSSDCASEAVIDCEDPETARRAGELAIKLVDAVLTDVLERDGRSHAPRDLASELEEIREFAADRRPSVTQKAIILAAYAREIPIIHLDRWPLTDDESRPPSVAFGSLQLGWGVHGVRLVGTATDRVSAATYTALRNRHALHERLSAAGIPVSYRDPEFRNINSTSRAVRVAARVGYPVVVRSEKRGICRGGAQAFDDSSVADSYGRMSAAGGRHVVVERHVPGDTYRLLVIGRDVAAALRLANHPTPGAVPGASEVSHTALDPSAVSAQAKASAVSAAQSFDLPIAAVDLVTPDPLLSLEESGGAIVDLDPSPDLAPYISDGEQLPIRVASAFLTRLFPSTSNGRIPICAITGTNGKTTTSRMVAKILQQAGQRVALACSDGVYVQGERLREGTYSGISGALDIFLHRNVDVAVLETSRGTLVSKGLAFDRCDAAACTNIASDHLDEEGIDSLEQMARLKRVVVESASRCTVVNAVDPLCMAMVPVLTAQQTYLISDKESSPLVDAHVAAGGKAVVLQSATRGESIALRDRVSTTPIINTQKIPATWHGAARHNVENAMFATALTLGLGVPSDIIRSALEAFSSSIEETPGRINVYDRLPYKVILDFAHNPHGLRALCQWVQGLRVTGRRHLVMYWTRTTPREADLMAAMEVVAPVFDSFICRDAAEMPEESRGKTARKVQSALLSAGAPADAVRVIPDIEKAIDAALSEAAPGDLVVIITGSKAAQVWQQVDTHRQRLEAGHNGT